MKIPGETFKEVSEEFNKLRSQDPKKYENGGVLGFVPGEGEFFIKPKNL